MGYQTCNRAAFERVRAVPQPMPYETAERAAPAQGVFHMRLLRGLWRPKVHVQKLRSVQQGVVCTRNSTPEVTMNYSNSSCWSTTTTTVPE